MSAQKNKKKLFSLPIFIFSTSFSLIDQFIENYFFFSESIPTNLNKKKQQLDPKTSRIVEINNQKYIINFKSLVDLNIQDLANVKNSSILFFILDVSEHTNFEKLINEYVTFMINENKCNFKGPILIFGVCDKEEFDGIETEKDEVETYLKLIDYQNIKYIDLTSKSQDQRFITINDTIKKLLLRNLIKPHSFSDDGCLLF